MFNTFLLLAIVLPSNLSFTLAERQTGPWNFDVASVALSKDKLVVGDTLYVTATIKNTGTKIGTVKVVLGIKFPEGSTIRADSGKIYDIPVGGEKSIRLKWNIPLDAPSGTYYVTIDVYNPDESWLFDSSGFNYDFSILQKVDLTVYVQHSDGSKLKRSVNLVLFTSSGEKVTEKRWYSGDSPYEFYDLNPGNYRIEAYSGNIWLASKDISLTSSKTVTLTVPRLGTLEVKVYYSDGKTPLENADCLVEGDHESEFMVYATTRTDSSGTCSFKLYPTVRSDEYYQVNVVYTDWATRYVGSKTNIRISEGKTTQISIITDVALNKPNLVPTKLSIDPKDPVEGQKITFNVEIQNRGTADSQDFYVNLYLDDKLVNQVHVEKGLGRNNYFVYEVEIPTIPAGFHEAKVIVDPDDRVDEGDDADNIKEIKFNVCSSNPSSIHVKINNKDDDPHEVEVYLDGVYWTKMKVEAGKEISSDEKVVDIGSHVVKIRWYDDDTAEYYEKEKSFQIKRTDGSSLTLSFELERYTEEAKIPDLTISDIYINPESPKEGQQISVTLVVSNDGLVGSDPFDIEFWLNNKYIGKKDLSGIAPKSCSLPITFNIGALSAGDYILQIILDPDNRIAETKEDNNQRNYKFTVKKKEEKKGLKVELISPLDNSENLDLPIKLKVRVMADSAPVKDAMVYFYLSNGGTHRHGPVSTDSNGYAIYIIQEMCGSANWYVEVEKEGFGSSKSEIWSFSLKKKGTIVISVTNNDDISHSVDIFIDKEFYSSLYVFAHESSSTKEISLASGTHEIMIRWEKEGTGEYIEKRQTISVESCKLQKVSFTLDIIPHGEAYSLSISSYTTDGKYNIGSIILESSEYRLPKVLNKKRGIYSVAVKSPEDYVFDHWEVSGEISLSDNKREAVELTISGDGRLTAVFRPKSKPDLIIKLDWNPKTPKEGDKVSFNVTVKNKGKSVVSGSFHIEIYIDGKKAGKREISDLEVNSAKTCYVDWMASKGIHRIKVVVDPEDLITESNEKNNIIVKELHVKVPRPINQEPIARLSVSPGSVVVGTSITFDASGSYDIDGEIVIYCFDFGDGSPLYCNEDPILTHTYNKPGTYYARVKVRDDQGKEKWSEKVKIEVREQLKPPRESLPNLVIKNVEVNLVEPREGDHLKINVTVANIGDENADSFLVACLIDSEVIAQQTVIGLRNGNSFNLTFDWNAKRKTKPESVIKIILDPDNRINEEREDDNVAYLKIRIKETQLFFKILKITTNPLIAEIGRPLYVYVTILNTGNDKIPAGTKFSAIIQFVDFKGRKPSQLRWIDTICAFTEGSCVFQEEIVETTINEDINPEDIALLTFVIQPSSSFKASSIIFTDTLAVYLSMENDQAARYGELTPFEVLPTLEEGGEGCLTLLEVCLSAIIAQARHVPKTVVTTIKVIKKVEIAVKVEEIFQDLKLGNLNKAAENSVDLVLKIADALKISRKTAAVKFIWEILHIRPAAQCFLIGFDFITAILKAFAKKGIELILVEVHSPVDVIVITKDGKRVGCINGTIYNEKENAEFLIIGDEKYIILLRQEINLEIYGRGQGRYTLSVFLGDKSAGLIGLKYKDQDVSPETKAFLSISKRLEKSYLKVDRDGDGKIDYSVRPNVIQKITKGQMSVPYGLKITIGMEVVSLLLVYAAFLIDILLNKLRKKRY